MSLRDHGDGMQMLRAIQEHAAMQQHLEVTGEGSALSVPDRTPQAKRIREQRTDMEVGDESD